MRKKTVIIISIVIILLAGLWLYKGYLYKDVRNISSEVPSVSLTATELMNQYSANQQKANTDFLNKTIEITGAVTQVADSVITLNAAVMCSFDTKPATTVSSKTVTIKGRCIGYDELFNEIKLDQCTLKP